MRGVVTAVSLAFIFLCPSLAVLSAPVLPLATVDVTRPSPLRSVPVSDGAALQTAINAAVDGDEILLSPGALYALPNGFKLPRRPGSTGWVIVRTNLAFPVGTRVSRALNLAVMTYSNAGTSTPHIIEPTWPREGGVFGFRFELINFRADYPSNSAIIAIYTDGGSWPVYRKLIVDRCWIHPANAGINRGNGIQWQASDFAVINSIIEDIKWPGTESHALGTVEGSGPHLVDNNWISAASIGFLVGGGAPRSQAEMAADVTITRNYWFKVRPLCFLVIALNCLLASH